jgi:predicted GNAT superfamily acetyltransferase
VSGAADPLAGLEFRELRHAAELAALPPFERRIWGGDTDLVSANMLVAVVSEGGVALAAFDDGEIVGAVFGFPTYEPAVLHSHYMAVDPAYRRRGLGIALKQQQRQWCLDRGITAMRWTYDPLQLANAHLNLQALGAAGVAYHVNHYGTLGGINGELPSDRVTVWWNLVTQGADRPTATLSIEVPLATADDIAASNQAALTARLAVRAELAERLGNGWLLVGVDREARRYHLAPNA